MKKYIKHAAAAGALFLALMQTGCTPEEQAFATGAAVGGVAGVALASYDHPYYYDRPYYYYRGRYYYGGHYHNGYYHYHGHRYHGGHYYYNGYRYYNGRRYRAQPGHYGYYRNASEYKRYHSRTTTTRRYYGSGSSGTYGTSRSTYRTHSRLGYGNSGYYNGSRTRTTTRTTYRSGAVRY